MAIIFEYALLAGAMRVRLGMLHRTANPISPANRSVTAKDAKDAKEKQEQE